MCPGEPRSKSWCLFCCFCWTRQCPHIVVFSNWASCSGVGKKWREKCMNHHEPMNRRTGKVPQMIFICWNGWILVWLSSHRRTGAERLHDVFLAWRFAQTSLLKASAVGGWDLFLGMILPCHMCLAWRWSFSDSGQVERSVDNAWFHWRS